MNIKARTLIIAFITISTVIIISDDLASISAVLGLISFIMICHFYLNRHQEDISTILKDYSNQLINTMKITTTPVAKIDEHFIPPNTNQSQLQPFTQKTPEQQVQEVMNIQDRVPKFPDRKYLTYLYEDNRINQLIQRQKPLKDVKNYNKLIHNQKYFHDLFDDEIQYNLQRSGFFNDEIREDKDICM